jgi:GPH family glycoside/pentoside/hexuronide:cation symporter
VGLLILPIPIIATALFVRERSVPAPRAGADTDWRSGIRLMLSNKPYLCILACYFVNGISNAFPVTLLFFYVKQVIERPDWTAIYLAVYFTAAIVGTPIWMFVANRLGKHVAWRYALILAILAFSGVPFLGSGDTIPFLFVAMVAGITLGADLAMPAPMLADVVDQDVLETGK